MQEMQETRVQSLAWEDPLEKEMATHSSTLAWRIPWTEELGRQQSIGLQSQTLLLTVDVDGCLLEVRDHGGWSLAYKKWEKKVSMPTSPTESFSVSLPDCKDEM